MMEIDLELALLDYPKEQLPELIKALPSGYVCEEKYDLGWGAVIRTVNDLPDNIDESLDEFFEGLKGIGHVLEECNGLLRVAIFYDTLTLTCRFNSIRHLCDYSIGLEVSTYPSNDSESE